MNPHEASPETLASFLDFDEAEGPALTIVDRSTLERYATCPAQARFIEAGKAANTSHIAAVGEAVHQAFSAAISEYIDSRGAMNPPELADAARGYLMRSRPDLQPDAIAVAKASLWSWARFIYSLHHENILRYDGGEAERSGQLAWDMPDFGLRLTAEVDLLHAGPAKESIHEIDYKSGHKIYSAHDVADSFQFAFHGWLVLQNYPEIEALQTRVWNIRTNRLTWAVEFTRGRLAELGQRVRQAAEMYAAYASLPPAKAPTWPTIEKCGQCPAAAVCPAVDGQPIADIAADPGAFVDRLVAGDAALDAMKALAAAFVDSRGGDIVSARGNCFGRGKPKADRRPTATTYVQSVVEESEPGESQ